MVSAQKDTNTGQESATGKGTQNILQILSFFQDLSPFLLDICPVLHKLKAGPENQDNSFLEKPTLFQMAWEF